MSAPHREASVLISASDVTLVEVLDLPLQQPAWRCSPMAAVPGGTRRQPFRCRAVTPTRTRHAAARVATPVEDLDCATRFDIDPLTERLGYAVRFVRTYPTRSSTKAASSAARRSTSRSATSTWPRRRSRDPRPFLGHDAQPRTWNPGLGHRDCERAAEGRA